jgi:hypothetical protein
MEQQLLFASRFLIMQHMLQPDECSLYKTTNHHVANCVSVIGITYKTSYNNCCGEAETVEPSCSNNEVDHQSCLLYLSHTMLLYRAWVDALSNTDRVHGSYI